MDGCLRSDLVGEGAPNGAERDGDGIAIYEGGDSCFGIGARLVGGTSDGEAAAVVSDEAIAPYAWMGEVAVEQREVLLVEAVGCLEGMEAAGALGGGGERERPAGVSVEAMKGGGLEG